MILNKTSLHENIARQSDFIESIREEVIETLPSVGSSIHRQNTLDLEVQQQEEVRVESFLKSRNLKIYYYSMQSMIDSLDENNICSRHDALCKYLTWKTRKWLFIIKKYESLYLIKFRHKLEQEYEQAHIVCKICACSVKLTKAEEHTNHCSKKASKVFEAKQTDKKIRNQIFDAFMNSKELNTKISIDQ